MKQIIFPTSAIGDVIAADDVKRNFTPLIGFVFHSGSKGFLLKSNVGSHTYVAIAMDSFERGNRWTQGNVPDKTLSQWFDYFNDKSSCLIMPKWFSFDTPKELFAWLAE